MKIPIEWKKILEENLDLKEMFLEQESIDMYGDEPIPTFFLHYFRPNKYKKLEEFFSPFPHGNEMYNKLKMIYDVTADNYENDDGSISGYFIPKQDKTISNIELQKIALKYAESINDILGDLDETSLINYDNLEINIISRNEFDEKYDYDDILECELYDLKGDWFIDLKSEISKNPLTFFAEPLYHIACDYNVARYIMWPLAEKHDMNNPFEAYVTLWKHGYEPSFVNNKLLILTY
ncbi:hypothetical protein SAMN02745163_02850 [Clostridium cavendishii DSM 21758]|uniref:Uncharacterized protein n=1 Tax=Clostridium cavendishii DSM 21758 TaxID=1121302 RepID=A0A1M6NAZ0_9CLOT|nr:hypothetical protein [Clostridium cavendishii]SHJ92889.1 hypothetical protein SAMN02745163_02850 [Clostridium cavendishii DSM 21758]